MTTGDKVIGYVRVSTDEQGNSGAGLEAQRAAVRSACERRGWELVRIEEDVLSGRTAGRPGLQRALEDCRSGRVRGVVVAKLDRLSRSMIDFAGLLEDARRRGYNVVALDMELDLSTPAGELVANVMASVAQWERRIIGERTKDALAVRRAEGVRLGRPPLEPDRLSRRVRRLRGKGASLRAIADRLNAEGVPTPGPADSWSPWSVRSVLRRKR